MLCSQECTVAYISTLHGAFLNQIHFLHLKIIKFFAYIVQNIAKRVTKFGLFILKWCCSDDVQFSYECGYYDLLTAMFLQVNWTKLLLALLLTSRSSYCDGFLDSSNDSYDPIDQSNYMYNHVLAHNSSLDTFNNCTNLLVMGQKLSTNSTCTYVQQLCKANVRLINYMSFALCKLEKNQVCQLIQMTQFLHILMFCFSL